MTDIAMIQLLLVFIYFTHQLWKYYNIPNMIIEQIVGNWLSKFKRNYSNIYIFFLSSREISTQYKNQKNIVSFLDFCGLKDQTQIQTLSEIYSIK